MIKIISKILSRNRIRNEASNDNLSRMVESIAHRIEFIRAELIYEMRYGLKESSLNQDVGKSEPKILAQEKLQNYLSSGALKINLGCGHKPMDGYINVDMRALPGVDVVATVDSLPFEESSVVEVYSSHLIEHFPEEKLVRHILPHWLRVLKPGGTVRIVAPDAGAMCKAFVNGEMGFRDLKEVTFGAQDYDGDFHYTMFTVESITEILTQVGFKNPKVLDSGRVNGLCRELEVIAQKN